MSDELFPQWYDSNDKGKYPFSLAATLTNDTLIIPDYLFADARLYPIGANQSLYISSVIKTDSTVTFYFSDSLNENIASAEYILAVPPSLINVTDGYGRDAGILVTSPERLTVINGWPVGTHIFGQEATGFCPSVITPMPDPGVRSFGDESSEEILYDDVYLVGGRGIQLDVDNTDPLRPVIVAHATGEPLFKRLMCDESGFIVPCFLEGLKDITGVKHYPDEYGNLYLGVCGLLAQNTLLRVQQSGNGLNISTVGKKVQ